MKEKTISEIIEEVCTEMCEKYCKHTDGNVDYEDIEEICKDCPLNRL